jgi:signal transduction histidine kinase
MDFRVFEATPGINVIVLPDAPVYTCVAVSNDFILALGVNKQDIIGKGLFEVFPTGPENTNFASEQDLRKSFGFIIKSRMRHDIPILRYDIPDGDGFFRQKYWKINNAPVLSDTGEVLYIIHSAIDITKQVMAEQKAGTVRDLKRAYNFFMAAPVIIGFVRGCDYIIELANEGLLQVWGKTDDVIGKPLFSAIPELNEQGFKALLDQVRETGEPFYAYEYPITLNRQGKEEVLYFDFVYKPFYENGMDKKANGVISVGHNVTEQVRTRQKFKNVLEQATEPILILKGEDMILEVANDALFKLWKVDSSAIGKTFLEILPEMKDQGFLELLQQVYHTGQPFHGYEIPAIFDEGNGSTRTLYFNFTYQPYREADGSITGVLVLATDVTGQVLAKKQAAELLRSNASLEHFTSAASHDMKEPLRKIVIFAERLKRSLSIHLDEKETTLLDRIATSAEHMRLLVDDLLEFSRVSNQASQQETVDLNDKILKVLSDLELSIEEKQANIIIDPLPTVTGNSRQLQQLFQNLLSNALKYSKPGIQPEISIQARVIQAADAPVDLPGDLAEKWFHLISVKDKGIGFKQQYAERIFDMFQRLHGKEEYSGTGVGLSIVRKIVENHHGYICASSEVGVGATFHLLLPAE